MDVLRVVLVTELAQALRSDRELKTTSLLNGEFLLSRHAVIFPYVPALSGTSLGPSKPSRALSRVLCSQTLGLSLPSPRIRRLGAHRQLVHRPQRFRGVALLAQL